MFLDLTSNNPNKLQNHGSLMVYSFLLLFDQTFIRRIVACFRLLIFPSLLATHRRRPVLLAIIVFLPLGCGFVTNQDVVHAIGGTRQAHGTVAIRLASPRLGKSPRAIIVPLGALVEISAKANGFRFHIGQASSLQVTGVDIPLDIIIKEVVLVWHARVGDDVLLLVRKMSSCEIYKEMIPQDFRLVRSKIA
jgi:hypothetical protein